MLLDHYFVVILSPLFNFVRSIILLETLVGISGSVWVENCHVKKIDIWPSGQNLCAITSNLASWNVSAVLCSNCLSVSFCNIGSMRILWHSSLNRLVFRFFSLLWLNLTKPLFLHVRICSVLKLLPHTYALGVSDNGFPYLLLTRFQNLCLLSMYYSSCIGRVISPVEASYSVLMFVKDGKVCY